MPTCAAIGYSNELDMKLRRRRAKAELRRDPLRVLDEACEHTWALRQWSCDACAFIASSAAMDKAMDAPFMTTGLKAPTRKCGA